MSEQDTIAGHVQRLLRPDGSETLLLTVKIYRLNALGEPETRKWVDKNGGEHEIPIVEKVLSLPISTVSKVINGEARRCLLFLRK